MFYCRVIRIKTIIKLLFIAAVISTGCSVLPKGGTSYSGEDRVFSKFFSFYKTEYRQALGREPGWELGIAFQCHKAGRIKGLHIKNPTKGMVPVTIWDANSRQIIFQLQANLDGSNVYNHIYLEKPIPVEAGRKYCVSINVTQYFYHVMPPGQLPMEANTITLLSSMYEDSHYNRYPQFEVREVLHGLIDLDMQWVVN
jgi:hypothetical protein